MLKKGKKIMARRLAIRSGLEGSSSYSDMPTRKSNPIYESGYE